MEVLVSPVVEACPSDNKEKAMSLLHSFLLLGTCRSCTHINSVLYVVGIDNWKILAIIWAVIPIEMLLFFKGSHCTIA